MIYAATWGINGGLAISTDGGVSFMNKTEANGLGSKFLRDVHVSGNNVYVATNNGVSISTNGGTSFVNKTTMDGLGNNLVYGVYGIGNDIYAATANGLSISTNGGTSFITKRTSDGLGSNTVNDVYVSGGVIYVATAGGLSTSIDDGATFTNYTSGLGSSTVTDVYASGGVVYATTNGGISICKNSSITATLVSSDADNKISSGDNVTFTATGGSTYQFFLNNVSVQNSASATYSTTTLQNGDKVKVTVMVGTCAVTTAEIATTVETPFCFGLVDILTVNNIIASGDYKAKVEVISDGTIASGITVIFQSGGTITFESGFSVATGANFSAKMGTCTSPAPFHEQSINATNRIARAKINLNIDIDFKIQPNPMLVETMIILQLADSEAVSIQVFDQAGRLVKAIMKAQKMDAGTHRIPLSMNQLRSGLFFVTLQTAKNRIVKKLVVVKEP